MSEAVWRVISGECLVWEPSASLRLTVVPTGAPGSVRFVVEDRGVRDRGPLPILSGYRESVAAAMRAAEDAMRHIGTR